MTRIEIPDGCWLADRGTAPPAGRPALLLDRDGTIMEDVGYPSRPEDVRLLPGAAALVAAANRAGWGVAVVTNQSGIGRGYFGWDAFAAVQRRLEALMALEGAHVDLVLACPFLPDSGHPWRKPAPGMPLAAMARLDADAARSWMVGDKPDDAAAGRAAGVLRLALVGGAAAPDAPDTVVVANPGRLVPLIGGR